MNHPRPHFTRSHRRPRWWPADEPWPPQGPPGHRLSGRMARFFILRLAGLIVFLLIFGAGGCALTVWLITLGLGMLPEWARAQPIVVIATVFILVFGFSSALRGFRNLALPIRDLIEAAGRVEAGDYAVRVRPHGPRELRALARSFNAMTERLQKDEEQRRRLLADVTHELRTPVAVIQGNLEGLLDGVYPSDEAHLAPIVEETRVLSRLIDDLRTLSLAESGALQLHREPTDLAVLAGETCASFRAQADAAGVTLMVEIPADLPLLDVDPVRIREVLTNLLANALRHTPAGGRVEIAAALTDGQVDMIVRDTGSGIAPEDLPHVFDRFYKSDESRGMGLGLAIAKNLVAAHGGAISAESERGQGTTIRFTLPLNPT